MSEISIELVPRSPESIAEEVDRIGRRFPGVHMVNVPDLLRFKLRSFEACRLALAAPHLSRALPHLRAIDFDTRRPFPLAATLAAAGLTEVLVVTGDAPQDASRRVHPTTAPELIACIKDACPNMRVYAAFDPYRSGLRDELRYAQSKRDAGADGLFTQPFFDLRLLEICAEQLAGSEVFFGITPVTHRRSQRYWETKNRAFFPAGFEPTLAWSRRIAADALAWARAHGANLYFMPIRADLGDWLDGVL